MISEAVEIATGEAESVRAKEAALDVEFVGGVDAFGSLEPAWRRLAAATATDNPFLAWEWVLTWAEEMMGERLVTAVVRDGDEVVAIAPLYRNRYTVGPGVKATCLQLYGPRELQTVFELRQIPMQPGRESAIVRSLLEGLAETPGWDWLELADYGPTTTCWREVLAGSPAGWRLVFEEDFQVPVLPLLPKWDEQRAALRRNVKERIRRGYNGLKREGHSFHLVIDTDPSSCDARLAEFHRLHALRAEMQDHKLHRNSFENPRLKRFLAVAARRMIRAGLLHFAALGVDHDIVATRLVLERNNRLYLYYSGFDPGWWQRSVMTVLVTEIVKKAISRSAPSVNFSPGLDQFKSGWTEPEANQVSAVFLVGRQTAAARWKLAAFRQRKRLSAKAATPLRWLYSRWSSKAG